MTRSPLLRGALLALALTVPIAGCGSSGSKSTSASTAKTTRSSAPASSAPASQHSVAVAISNYAYKPVDITVAPGARLTFTNHDATAHTATSNKPAFDTGTVKPGQSRTVTLTKPGTYTFYCQFHPFMHGQVTVR